MIRTINRDLGDSEEEHAEVGEASASEQRDRDGDEGHEWPGQRLQGIGDALGALAGRVGEDLADGRALGPRRCRDIRRLR